VAGGVHLDGGVGPATVEDEQVWAGAFIDVITDKLSRQPDTISQWFLGASIPRPFGKCK